MSEHSSKHKTSNHYYISSSFQSFENLSELIYCWMDEQDFDFYIEKLRLQMVTVENKKNGV